MSTKADIKAATRRIVHHDQRTCQVTADFLGVTKGEVSYWCSDHHDRFIPVDHLMDLDAVSGDAFLKEWAALGGMLQEFLDRVRPGEASERGMIAQAQ